MEENTSKVFVGRNDAALVDPLLAPITPSAPASSLFVINLCASIAPVQTAGKTIPGFETYKLYQVARSEDGRTRHRLRLGFFTSEEDAERVLASVRDNYPTAFVTCLSDDDRRFARGFLPDTECTASWKRPVIVPEKPAAPKPAVVKVAAAPAPAPVAPLVAPVAAAPAPVKAAAPALAPKPVEVAHQPETKPAPRAPAPAPKVTAPQEDITAIELSWDPPALEAPKPAATNGGAPAQTIPAVFKTETVIKASPPPAAPKPEPRAPQTSRLAAPATPAALSLATEPAPAPAAATPAAAPSGPFHVGKGVEIPAVGLSLESTGIQPAVAAKAPAPAVEKKTAPVAKEPVQKAAAPTPKSVKAEPAAPATPAARVAASARAPELDSTQTIRALTSAELNDDSQEKWFAIQLVVSERPVNLDAMPHLDIFEAYRVYSIANAGSGKIVYSLRLGFFREEVSAEAVSGYLRTFFPSPTVMRISAAEQARFKDAPVPKATAVAASKSDAKVIELNPARKPAAVPTVTMEVTDRSPTGTFKPNATGAFKVNASGTHKALATGTHKALKPAAKHAPPATRRSAPLNKTSATGKHKALQPKKSLQEQLLDEARDTILSESAIRKLPKNDSLLSRLVGKLTK